MMTQKAKRRWYILTACLLAAVDLFICATVDMSGEVFGLPATAVLVVYLSVAGLLLLTLIRLLAMDRRYWPLLVVWALWHFAMMPAW